jgi:hypothetical protein
VLISKEMIAAAELNAAQMRAEVLSYREGIAKMRERNKSTMASMGEQRAKMVPIWNREKF